MHAGGGSDGRSRGRGRGFNNGGRFDQGEGGRGRGRGFDNGGRVRVRVSLYIL